MVCRITQSPSGDLIVRAVDIQVVGFTIQHIVLFGNFPFNCLTQVRCKHIVLLGIFASTVSPNSGVNEELLKEEYY